MKHINRVQESRNCKNYYYVFFKKRARPKSNLKSSSREEHPRHYKGYITPIKQM